jgi:hypothetical protein
VLSFATSLKKYGLAAAFKNGKNKKILKVKGIQ